ncbi:hypothetical protein AcV7_003232 [Taiwanofungus camphoratus]|nr:hypothetical protein AcV7_003232 [Antrodia cinnamomea]
MFELGLTKAMISVWGPIMSAYAHGTQPKQVALQAIMYIVSSTFQHNAACIWNDICDRDIDCRVERTKNRPIASGKISVPKAVLFMILNCIIYLATLFCGGTTVLQITILGLLTLDAIYPLTKQFSNWPQAFLGLDIAWGLSIAQVVNNNSMDWQLVAVLTLGIIW